MESMTVLLLLLTIKGLLLVSSGVEYYVKPTSDTKCPEPCHTLSHYMARVPVVPNTTFHFLPGVFTLNETNLIWVSQADGIALIGSEHYTVANLTSDGYQYQIPASEIECFGPTGIAFCAGNNIVIKHFRMRNCYFALQFLYTTDVNVYHVLIENSSVVGIHGHQMMGNNSIVDSAFVRNAVNAKFNYSRSAYEAGPCQLRQEDRVMVPSQVEIQGSYFLEGYQEPQNGYQDPQYGNAGGLTISIQEFTVSIIVHVTDTIFFQNRGNVGGNMAVYVQGRGELTQKNAVVVENCSFVKGSAHGGGGIALVVDEYLCDNVSPLQPGTFLHIRSSRFLLNHATASITNESNCVGPFCGSGGAVLIVLLNCKPAEVLIINCSFLHNKADISGAGIEILDGTYSTVVNTISINHTVFVGGSAGHTGGGIRYVYDIVSLQREDGSLSYHAPTNFQIYQATFSENTAGVHGGAMLLLLQGAGSSSNQIIRQIEITDCDITNNTALGSGVPASLVISSDYPSLSHKVVITDVSIRHHGDVQPTSDGRVLLVANMNAVWFINCSFYNNNVTALMAWASRLTFHGNNTFVNNRGGQGGALALYESSMYLDNNTLLVLKDNKARRQGGGIFVAKKISLVFPYQCFFQIISHVNYASLSQFNIHIVMENNTAPTGSALFGGLVDFCRSKSILADDKKVPLTYPEGKWIFDTIFEIKPSKANDTSVISSDALDACFCENDLVQCGVRTKNVTVYPGGTLNTSLVTVGQRNGTVPGSIAILSNGSYLVPHATRSSDYYTQCKYLKQQIFSQEKVMTVQFVVTSPIFIGLQLSVSLLDCPPGFILTPYGSCDCVPVLKHYSVTCTIDDQTVHRIAPLWIGYQPPPELDAHSNITAQDYSNSSEVDGTVLHKHCPLDYCKTEDVDMWLNDTDQQCAHHRSGVLCGGCKPGFSIAFGSSRCLTCTSSYLALVLVFAGAGVALVALLMLCDLTVSEGTLNGLVFYANVVQANSSTFFPNTRNQILSIFIAWLNLDLGIETCFYDGMDMYAKAWLLFVFPLYIWFLVFAIIVSSNYSITAAKLAGRNGPKVLSTLLLLSDARILRAVITTFSYTSLSVPSDYRETLVWLYDGNINYLSGKHIPLFIAGLLYTVLFLIPYTLAVCLIQYLQRHSGFRLLRWVQRIKPLLKAYTCPYKDKYRFWTGLLLLVRVVLFLATAVNTLGDPSLNLLLIIVTANCLLALEWILRGIYKEWPLDILEASSLLNLSILSAATLYIRSAGGNQVAITSTSTGIALATFVGILIHHTYNSITTSTNWRRLVAHLKRHLKTQNTHSHELEPLATGTGSSSSDSDSEGVRMEPHARIQPLRLTFDTNNEPILVAASGDHARVQRQTIDQDEECILVVEDNSGG